MSKPRNSAYTIRDEVQGEQEGPHQYHESFGSASDPIVKLMAEQQAFNHAWVGRKPQRTLLQKVGFFVISFTFAVGGFILAEDTFPAAKQGAVYLTLIGVGSCIVGLIGVLKSLRRG